tara:strand:+ start:251 stop:523 length:273 start_codon:yes stop_codon:yes gene_type:complete
MVLALPLHFSQGIGPKIFTLGKLIEISFALVAVGKPDRFALDVSSGPLSFKSNLAIFEFGIRKPNVKLLVDENDLLFSEHGIMIVKGPGQ